MHDVDDRAQAGIKQAQGSADSATQNAQNATRLPAMRIQRRTMPCIAPTRWTALSRNLDNYKPMANVTVTFGFDKAVLTEGRQGAARQLSRQQLGSAKSYILEVPAGQTPVGSG